MEQPGGQSPFSALGRAASRRSPGSPRLRWLAFLGRTSTDDLQDPTISLPRQLRACSMVLPEDMAIVAFFYDVETGRADLESRGRGRAHEQFDIPLRRDGGIQDLLDEAGRADRRFDAVICESVDRVARRTYYGVVIEHALEQAGVPLLAADEPGALADPRGTHATRVLTRRVKQGIAEWYVLDMLEKSRAGFEEHTRQGFNIGSAPYGYAAARVPHPVPARRAEGKSKTRPARDPKTASVVAQIFTWRVGQRMSYAAIAAELDADPSRYPPPVPTDPRRAVGHWTGGSVRGILDNPKYTGYMVWNRKATKRGGKYNDVADWVYSLKVTHPPIISVATFIAAAEVGRSRQGSRTDPGANTHPATQRTYLLRGYVVCVLCGHRLCGSTRRGHVYMLCPPHSARQDLPGHAHYLLARQDALVTGLQQFLAEHVLGPNRARLLADTTRTDAHRVQTDHRRRLDELDEQIQDLSQRRARLLASLEQFTDPDPDLIHSIQVRMTQLRTNLEQAETARRDLSKRVRDEPNPELLNLLPVGRPNLDRPEPQLRQLLDLLQLEIRYHRPSSQATYRCTLSPLTIHAVIELLSHGIAVDAHPASTNRPADPHLEGKLVLAGRYTVTPTGNIHGANDANRARLPFRLHAVGDTQT